MDAIDYANSLIDRPFAPPLEVVLDLPFPPSTNKLWRKTSRGVGMMLSNEYIAWKDQAARLVMAKAQLRGVKKIMGSFEVQIIIDRGFRALGRRGDLDNKIKAVMDAAQQFDVIQNDRYCERLVAEWGTAPEGCRLILKPWEGA